MNAPAKFKTPELAAGLPLNLVPYKDGEFDKMHAAGSMLCSASNVAAIFNKIPQRYGKLAYAMHLKGDRPLPDPSAEPLIRVGHALEQLVADLLAEEIGAEVTDFDAYAMHPWLKLFATPDRVIWIDGEPWIVEIKVVTPKVYWRDWKHGPPIHVNLQHQSQFACTGAKRGIVAVFNLGWCQLEPIQTRPHQPTIEKIELGVDSFMALLDRGEMPSPDDTEVDFEAFRQLMWQSDPEEAIALVGEEAERRASQFVQAKRDEAAATKTIEAHRRWFQGRMCTAQRAIAGDGFEVEWKTNKTKPKGAERPNRVFKIKEVKGEDDG